MPGAYGSPLTSPSSSGAWRCSPPDGNSCIAANARPWERHDKPRRAFGPLVRAGFGPDTRDDAGVAIASGRVQPEPGQPALHRLFRVTQLATAPSGGVVRMRRRPERSSTRSAAASARPDGPHAPVWRPVLHLEAAGLPCRRRILSRLARSEDFP